jgi:hypothetical protein
MKVAIELFHGRTSPDEHLDDWGCQGPVFLVEYVHVTYAGDLKLGLPEPAGDGDLRYVDDLVVYDGIYYGDWSVFPEALLQREPELKARLVPYNPALAARPEATDPAYTHPLYKEEPS